MVPFQHGDAQIRIGETTYIVRLSLGALAEISYRLSLSSLNALIEVLSPLEVETGRVLLESLIRPCHPCGGSDSPVTQLSDTDIARILPIICEVFENAFRTGT